MGGEDWRYCPYGYGIDGGHEEIFVHVGGGRDGGGDEQLLSNQINSISRRKKRNDKLGRKDL